ncbi:hypothetical protein D3C76_1826230 [compost metagenome]
MVIEGPAEGDDCVFDRHQVHGLLIAAFHFGFIATNDRADAWQDRQFLRIATEATGAFFQILSVG